MCIRDRDIYKAPVIPNVKIDTSYAEGQTAVNATWTGNNKALKYEYKFVKKDISESTETGTINAKDGENRPVTSFDVSGWIDPDGVQCDNCLLYTSATDVKLDYSTGVKDGDDNDEVYLTWKDNAPTGQDVDYDIQIKKNGTAINRCV